MLLAIFLTAASGLGASASVVSLRGRIRARTRDLAAADRQPLPSIPVPDPCTTTIGFKIVVLGTMPPPTPQPPPPPQPEAQITQPTAATRIAPIAPVDASARCANASSCSSCTAFPECGWCAIEQRCVHGDKIGPYGGVQCAVYDFVHCSAIPCSSRSTCAECLPDHGCGWCGSANACVDGSSTGPYDFAACPTPPPTAQVAAVAPSGSYAGAAPFLWAHAESPMQCEDVPPANDDSSLWTSLRSLMWRSEARMNRLEAVAKASAEASAARVQAEATKGPVWITTIVPLTVTSTTTMSITTTTSEASLETTVMAAATPVETTVSTSTTTTTTTTSTTTMTPLPVTTPFPDVEPCPSVEDAAMTRPEPSPVNVDIHVNQNVDASGASANQNNGQPPEVIVDPAEVWSSPFGGDPAEIATVPHAVFGPAPAAAPVPAVLRPGVPYF